MASVGPGGGLGDTWEYVCGGTCYANCDGSTTPPILNIADFVCFQQLFAAGSPAANCDQSTAPPTRTVRSTGGASPATSKP